MVKASKPNRSEEQSVTQEEQEQHALQVRAYLDANAPHRQLKPARSDAAETISIVSETSDALSTEPPERSKYLQLLATGVPLETQGSRDMSDDFTESDYYQYMAATDKAHHTTGTGFINVAQAPDQGFHLSNNDVDQAHTLHPHHRSNPAMNDWEPAPTSTFLTSSKPTRSESSS